MKATILSFFACVVFSMPSFATLITADLRATGGNSWEANYTVVNNTLSSAIEEFTIFFDVDLYGNISILSTPTDWDPLIIQPDTSIPDDGFYDALALSSGIATDESLGGFQLSFDWFGSGDPGPQLYQIIHPLTFSTLDSGVTNYQVTSVPEPFSLTLLVTGLLGISIFRIRKYV